MNLSDQVMSDKFTPTNDTNVNANPPKEENIDPVWLSSRTARQIHSLCQVEKVSANHHAVERKNKTPPLPLRKSGG